ncbi:MAG: response regulator transcription factor [Actinomycetota bacterium]|nr:response regulator transcription factor [Actinomycetota bacterium]
MQGIERPSRVLVVDDHPLFRQAFAFILSKEEGLEVVGEAEDGLGAMEACQELRPDLVLMDLSMPKMGGMEATRRIKGLLPQTAVLIVTADASEDLILEAVRAGAAGYVLKSEKPQGLVAAARAVLAGDSPIDAGLAGRLVRRLAAEGEDPNGRPQPAPVVPTAPLTPREIEVLAGVVAGKTNRAIAGELHMSNSTVKRHLERVVKKLGVSDRTQAAVRATELGLLSE